MAPPSGRGFNGARRRPLYYCTAATASGTRPVTVCFCQWNLKAHLIDGTYPRRHTANPPRKIRRVEALQVTPKAVVREWGLGPSESESPAAGPGLYAQFSFKLLFVPSLPAFSRCLRVTRRVAVIVLCLWSYAYLEGTFFHVPLTFMSARAAAVRR